MTPYPYTLNVSGDTGDRTLTIYPGSGQPVIVVPGDSPSFSALLDEAEDGLMSPAELVELADAGKAIENRFAQVTERVSVLDGKVYLDGEEMVGALVDQILRAFDGAREDDNLDNGLVALAAFYEKLADNPNAHSREQLYGFLDAHDFTITQAGNLIAYKGVTRDTAGALVSRHSGHAIVDGIEVRGQVPNREGVVVEMPRDEVAHDPRVACHRGLHVGTFDYAKGWAEAAMLKVAVNPRDVVSVPDDAHGGKVRVCRYRVLAVIEKPEAAPIVFGEADANPEDERLLARLFKFIKRGRK